MKGLSGSQLILVILAIFYSVFQNLIFFFKYCVAGVEKGFLFSLLFNNLFHMCLIFLPYISNKLESHESSLEGFISLPPKGEKVTYPIVATFLSEQSLGAFLGSTLMITTSSLLDSTNEYISAAYCFILFLISIMFVTFSFIRFMWYFIEKVLWKRALVLVVSAGIMHLFLSLGFAIKDKI
jgi:hypothetical protein